MIGTCQDEVVLEIEGFLLVANRLVQNLSK